MEHAHAVYKMAAEVSRRHAKAQTRRTGEVREKGLSAVAGTEAGQPRNLRHDPRREKIADEGREVIAREWAEEQADALGRCLFPETSNPPASG